MAAAYADSAWREQALAQMESIADQTDFLDGDIAGYFRRTSVEETGCHCRPEGVFRWPMWPRPGAAIRWR